MKRQIAITISLIIISLTLVLGLLIYLKKGGSYKNNTTDAIDINLIDINGSVINKTSLNNRGTIIIFFNTQCDLCLSEMSFLSNEADQINSHFNLIFVSFEPKDSLQLFFEEYNLHNNPHTYIVSDMKAELLNLFEIEGYPSFVFLDPLGRIAKRGSDINAQTITVLSTLNTSN